MWFQNKWYCRQCGQITYDTYLIYCPNCGGCCLEKIEDKKKKKGSDGSGLLSLIYFLLKWGIIAAIGALAVAYKGAKVLFGLIKENIQKTKNKPFDLK